jgi:tryptophan synthase alpha chain
MKGDGAARIERAILGARESGRPALAPFLTAGFPDTTAFPRLLERVAAEADLVEIGVPFSDPMADGVTIQRSSETALAAGVDLPWILETLSASPGDTPYLLMSYLNPLLAFGLERLAAEAPPAGVAGLIVPDLPLEESGALRQVLDGAGLAQVQLVTPVTSGARFERICRASRGFVYAVTVAGITGSIAGPTDGLFDYLDRVREASEVPVLAGFGVRTAGQLRDIARHADGAIVGSALIEVIERGEDPVAFLRGLRGTAPTGEEVRA